jgi:hypothetical protein
MIKDITVRFFISNSVDLRETNNTKFETLEGVISYERDTVFENGVRQICLTKEIEGELPE